MIAEVRALARMSAVKDLAGKIFLMAAYVLQDMKISIIMDRVLVALQGNTKRPKIPTIIKSTLTFAAHAYIVLLVGIQMQPIYT